MTPWFEACRSPNQSPPRKISQADAAGGGDDGPVKTDEQIKADCPCFFQQPHFEGTPQSSNKKSMSQHVASLLG